MDKIKMALKDEKVNIYSMTMGGFNGKFSHQILLCKKYDQIDDWITKEPLLLIPKSYPPEFDYSESGEKCEEAYENKFGTTFPKFPLEYVAFVKEIIKVKTAGIAEELCKEENGVFNLWHPEGGPGRYWKGAAKGLLVLFRVHKIFTNGGVPRNIIHKAKSDTWKYRILGPLKWELTVNKEDSVLTDSEFQKIRESIFSILNSKSAVIESYPVSS